MISKLSATFLLFTVAIMHAQAPDLGIFSIGDYGAVGDSKVGYNCSVPAGTNTTLTCSDPNVTFSSSDAGHTIWIYGSNSTQYYVATPGITIASVINSQSVVLAGTLSQSVSNGMIQVIGATDNSAAIQNTITAACSTATVTNPATVFTPAGVYGYRTAVQIPGGCSNVKLQASGKAIWLNTTILGNTYGKSGYGQGTEALTISPGISQYTQQIAGTSITAGSNLLTCTTCSFTSANIGQPIYVQSAGPDGLPLWTTITAVSGNVATLADNAQTTMSPSNLGGPLLTWGYQLSTNIEISGMEFQNVGYYYNPTQGYVSTQGLPVVITHAGSVLQGFFFHDSVITSATNTCYRGDGVSDQFKYENVTCHGGTDVAMSFYGPHSNGLVTNATVDNTQWPLPKTSIVNALTIKGSTHVTFQNPTLRCFCSTYLFAQSDMPAFDVTISNPDFDGEGSPGIGIASGLSTGFVVNGGQIRTTTGDAFLFFGEAVPNSVQNLTVQGVTATNVGGGASFTDYSGTGHGVKNIVFDNNEFHTTGGNGVGATNVEGLNFWRQNSLFGNGSANAAWVLVSGTNGAMNVFSNNFATGYGGSNQFDSSLVQGTLQDFHWATAPVLGALVKPSSVNNQAVVPLGASDTAGAIGVAVNVSGSGSTGNVMVQEDGPAEVITDGNMTLGDYVTYSTVISGAVHDTGSSGPPPQPMAVVGTVAHLTTSVSISSLSTDANSVMTVTTSSADNLIVGEPFTITGAKFNGSSLNTAGVVTSVPSATSFTFQSQLAANQTGSGGQVNPPALINLNPVNPVAVSGGKTSVVLRGQYASTPTRTIFTNGGSSNSYFVSAEIAQDSSVTCSTYGYVTLNLAWHELDGNISSAAATYNFVGSLAASPGAQRLGPYGVLVPAGGTIYVNAVYTPGTGCSGNGSTYTLAVQVQ